MNSFFGLVIAIQLGSQNCNSDLCIQQYETQKEGLLNDNSGSI